MDTLSIFDRNYYDLVKEWTVQYGDLDNPTDFNIERQIKKINRFRYFWAPLVHPFGGDLRAALNSYSQKNANSTLTSARNTTLALSDYPINWKELGPFIYPSYGPGTYTNGTGIGRVSSLAFHPTNDEMIFTVSEKSGIFLSRDEGNSWEPLTDNLPVFHVGSADITISTLDTDRWFVANGSGDGDLPVSEGVFLTKDEGETWINLTQSAAYGFPINSKTLIRKLIFDPHDSKKLYVATNQGIYRTTNANDYNFLHGYASASNNYWERVTYFPAYDIEFHPTNPNVVYASGEYLLWSLDKGNTWKKMPGSDDLHLPTPYDSKSTDDYCDDEGWTAQRFSLELNKNAPDNLWITHCAKRGESTGAIPYLARLYLFNFSDQTLIDKDIIPHGERNEYVTSFDANAAFCINKGTGVGFSRARAFVVDKFDPQNVFVGNVNPIYKFEGATTTWVNKGQKFHDDIHHFDYDNTGRLWAAHDGGVSVSNDNGVTWHNKSVNINLGIAQVYHLDSPNNNENRMIIGLQDDGSLYYDNLVNGNKWKHVSQGDGFECKYSQVNEDYFYTTVNTTGKEKTTSAGVTMSNTFGGGVSRRITPSAHNSNIIYAGGVSVFKSINNGVNFNNIANFLNDFGLISFVVWDTYTTPAHPNYLYTHVIENASTPSERHRLFLTTNSNLPTPTWTEIILPQNNWYSIFTHNTNPNQFWIRFSRADNNIYEYNGSFTDITYGQIRYPTDVEHEFGTNRIYVTSQFVLPSGEIVKGVSMREGSATSWTLLDKEKLPNVDFSDVDIVQGKGILRVATYARGVWETPVPCYFDNSSNYEPIDGTIISSSTDINQNMIIKSGRRVKIENCLIKMSQHASIIVEPGAILEVYNTTIRNRCKGSQWGGIQVMGDATKQMPANININLPSYSSFQGMLIIENSVIKDAHEAFQNHRQYNYGADLATTGGMIYATNTTFENCWRSAEFLKYDADDYNSSFSKCTFLCTDDYRGIRSDENGINKTINAFVTMWAVDGVSFLGNVFDNQVTYLNQDKKGAGIIAIDAAYTIDSYRGSATCNICPISIEKRAEFKNLTYAIENYANQALGLNLVVKSVHFTNNLKGILDVGSSYSSIIENKFIIPESEIDIQGNPELGDGYEANYGIFTLTSTAFDIKDNEFESIKSVAGKTATYGLVVRESGSQGGEIVRNSFTNISMSTQMEDFNLALKLSCNEYLNYDQAWTIAATTNSDVYPPPPPVQHLANQGAGCGNNQEQADNTFDVCGNELQIYSSTPFTYYDKNLTNSNLNSACFSTSAGVVNCNSNQQPQCSASSGGSGGGSGLQSVTSLISKVNNTPNANEKQLEENKLIKKYLKENKKLDAINYLQAKNDLESKKILVATLLKNKDFGSCMSTLNSITATDNETIAFKEFNEILVNACSVGRGIDKLNNSEIDEIELITHTNTSIRYAAENVLRIAGEHNKRYNPYIVSENITAARSNYQMSNTNTVKSRLLSVYPNPTSEVSNIYYSVDKDEIAMINIIDVFGKIVKNIKLERGKNTIILDGKEIGKGIFYLNMIVNDENIKVEKLIFQ